jgi:hypothetical protein
MRRGAAYPEYPAPHGRTPPASTGGVQTLRASVVSLPRRDLENPPTCLGVCGRKGTRKGKFRDFVRETGCFRIRSSYMRRARKRGCSCVVVRGRVLTCPRERVRLRVRLGPGIRTGDPCRGRPSGHRFRSGSVTPRRALGGRRRPAGSGSAGRRVRPSGRGRPTSSGRTYRPSSRRGRDRPTD